MSHAVCSASAGPPTETAATSAGSARQDELCALITRHCATLRQEAAAVGEALSGWGGDDGADGAERGWLTAAIGSAHKIKGSSGSIGFMELSATATELETLLRDLSEQAVSPTADDRSRADALNERLTRQAAELRPEHSRLFDRRLGASSGPPLES